MDSYWEAVAASSFTYENAAIEAEDIPYTQSPVIILGEQYSALHDREEIRAEIKTRVWCTYRRNFPAISDAARTADTSWGCMHRAGQMVLAQALINLHLGRDWRKTSDINPTYLRILRMFEDKKSALYSIHQIASMGVTEGRQIGEWFGPNTVAQVIKKLAVYDDWSNLAVHISMDNAIIMDDLAITCTGHSTAPSSPPVSSRERSGKQQTPQREHSPVGASEDDDGYDCIDSDLLVSDSAAAGGPASMSPPRSLPISSEGRAWKPLLLFIPLRLGLSEINECYMEALKRCFNIPYSVGVLGGRPSHALWFFGYIDNELLFLDPHTTQPAVDLGSTLDVSSYHCPIAGRMGLSRLDPSLCLAFFCPTEEDVQNLSLMLMKQVLRPFKTPMFEIHQRRPAHLPPFRPYRPPSSNTWDSDEVSILPRPLVPAAEARQYDSSDNEFEII